MVVYVDVLIFINIIINYMILCAVRRFLCAKSSQIRIIIAAFVGSLFSLTVFLKNSGVIISFILKLLCATIISFIAFKGNDVITYLKYILTTFIFTITFTSFAILYCQIIKPENIAIVNDTFYVHINPLLLIIISLIFYLLFYISKNILKHNSFRSLVNVKIIISDKEYTYLGKVDTGNSVTEPFSGAPVIITESSIFEDYSVSRPRIIPYKVLNGDGFIFGFKPQRVYIDNKLINKDVYIGLYNGTIDHNFKAIINSKIIG